MHIAFGMNRLLACPDVIPPRIAVERFANHLRKEVLRNRPRRVLYGRFLQAAVRRSLPPGLICAARLVHTCVKRILPAQTICRIIRRGTMRCRIIRWGTMRRGIVRQGGRLPRNRYFMTKSARTMAVTANGGVLQIVRSVIHTEKFSFLVEFQVKAVAEFHFIPPMLLIDLGDCHLGKSS